MHTKWIFWRTHSGDAYPYWLIGESGETRFADAVKPLPALQGRILDAGCYNGDSTRELSRLYPDATIIPLDVKHFAVSRAQTSISPGVVGDAYLLPFADGALDAIVLMHNLYYALPRFSDERLDVVLRRFAGALAPQSHLVLTGKANVTSSDPDDALVLSRHGMRVDVLQRSVYGSEVQLDRFTERFRSAVQQS